MIVINKPGDGQPVIFFQAFCFNDVLNILDFERRVCAAHGSGGFTLEDFDGSAGQCQMEVAGQVRNY